MLSIGLTGNIGAGKSTAARCFARHGCVTLDADALGHQLLAEDPEVRAAIRDRFGPAVFTPEGEIDRKALGARAFADPAALAFLNQLLHPRILAARERLLAPYRDSDAIVVTEAALIFEAGTGEGFDRVVVVTCRPELQRQRLRARGDLDESAITERIASQWPPERKAAAADDVLENNGTEAELDAQVQRLVARWRARA